jgi:hypothetical protein
MLAVSGIAVVGLVLMLPVIPYGRAIWDFLFVLDGAYRIELGQLPHVDFSSPVGSLTLFMAALAERLFPDSNPFVGLHAIMWLATLPALALLATRFQSGTAFAIALLLTSIMILVPFTVDSTHLSEISYFATYNRFATGLLFLVGLWYVLPKSRFDWVLLAYLLALLFFLKITTAAVAVGIVLAAVILGRARFATLAGALLGVGALLLAVDTTTGLVSAYFADIRFMASVNQGGAVYALFFTAFRNGTVLAVVAGLAVITVAELVSRARLLNRVPAIADLIDRADFGIAAILLVGAALLAESQNTGGIGLVAAAALFFHPRVWEGGTARLVATGLLAAALFLPVADIALKRPITALKRERDAVAENPIEALLPGTRVPVATAEGAKLFAILRTDMLPLAREVSAAGFFLDPDPTTNAPAAQLAWAIGAVEAGHAFERNGYRDPATHYATLAFADPFSRMLGLTPARGTKIAIDIGRTMPVMSEAEADAYLADAGGVFVDRCQFAVDPDSEKGFDAVLGKSFQKLPLHPCWDFYRRIAGSPEAM